MEKEGIILKLENRPGSLPQGALRQLRKDGWIPAILYGGKEKTTHFSVWGKEFLKELSVAGIYKRVFLVDGCKAKVKAVAFEPIKDHVLHIDFIRI